MIEVGRLCIKIAGKDAGAYCVVVDKVDDNFVLIDGNVKRKRCNISHLEPLEEVLKIKKGASTATVHEAMKKLKIKVVTKKSKKKEAVKPVKKRKKKKEEAKETKEKKEKK